MSVMPLRSALTLFLGLGLAGSLVAGVGPSSTPTAEAAVPAKSGIYLGSAGDVETLRQRTGQSLASHDYGYFERKVPTGRMVTVRFENNMLWRNTAALKAGSTGYQQIVTWADTLKARGGEVLLAFHSEPEHSGAKKFGTPEEFRAAYRRVVDIFRARGANNVVFTWQMTAYAFRADPSEYNYAPNWYPGNAYVDVVGADPYNWFDCGHGRGRWMSLKDLSDPAVSFARARGKQFALPEFASVRDSRRPAWLKEAGQWLAANDDVVVAAFYFNRKPTNSANAECTWPLSTDADYTAFRSLATQATFTH